MTEVVNNSVSGSGSSPTVKVFCTGKPYIFFSSNFKILDCNDDFLKLTAISRGEINNLDLTSHKQNAAFNETVVKAAAQGISTYNGPVVFGKDISGFNIEAVFFSIQANDIDHTNGIICYILESNKLAGNAYSSYTSAASANGFNSSENASVTVHTVDGRAIYVSSSTEFLLGYSCAELKELPLFHTVHPDDLPFVMQVIDKLKSGVDFLNSEYRMVHKNGSIVHVETSSYVISDDSGITKHIVNITWDLSSHTKFKQALELSEQKYYRLVMNLSTGVSLIRNDGKLMEANDAMKKIMGLSLNSPLPELNFFELETMKRFGISDQLKLCIRSKDIVEGELPFKSRRTGKDIFLTYSFLPVLSLDGSVETVIGYVSDLSHQKEVEASSREHTEFLNLVINAIKVPFFVKDEEHKWVMLNDAAVEMMGHPHNDLVGKSDYDLYPEKQADVFWKYDEFVFENGSSSNEEQITWSDETLRTIVTYKQLYVEKSTGKKFIVGTIQDITPYKKIEEELRASELKYHELFDNANDFIITLDLNGNITNANRTLLNHLKVDFEKIISLNVYDFVSEENKETAFQLRENVLNGSIDNPFEISVLNLDGQPVTYEIKASLIQEDGHIVGVQCVFSDVTERLESRLKLEKYNRNLVELNKTKDKFFSIIAHDLRNPYSSIIGFSELLLEDLEELSKDEIRDSLKIIRNAAKNSLNLLENLLAWSRLETGRMPFDPVKIVLSDAIEEVVNVLFSLAYRKKIEIENRVETDFVLKADKNMLNSILNNLIMNSIKFTPIGGNISIEASDNIFIPGSNKEFVKIKVTDTGIGIEASVRDRLFTSTKPESSIGTAKEEGTGLGLMLAREMVERHGGIISVESTPGIGSAFSFTVPAYKPE